MAEAVLATLWAGHVLELGIGGGAQVGEAGLWGVIHLVYAVQPAAGFGVRRGKGGLGFRAK